ncbi:MAG: HD domain-containing protein [Spirochaetia bacterium]|nr:HD domain-containing protein [Spirochaetia bacterium]
MLKLIDILNHNDCQSNADLEIINNFLITNISTKRYEHSLKTVEFAIQLASQNKFENKGINKLILAALSHDITKEKPPEFHVEIFIKYKCQNLLNLPKAIYHSKSAPFFIGELFNIKDDDISHAISHHSTGCAEMPLFSRIIFSADFLASQNSASSMKLLKLNLQDLCLEKASTTIKYLLSEKLPVQPESINFYNILLSEKKI